MIILAVFLVINRSKNYDLAARFRYSWDMYGFVKKKKGGGG